MSTPALVFYPGVLRPVVSPISDGLNSVSTVIPVYWDVSTRISSTARFQWNVVAYGISASKAFSFETTTRLHKIGNMISYGICHPVVWPIDRRSFIPAVSYDADFRFSTSKKLSWKINKRISSVTAVRFSTLVTDHAHSPYSFNTLQEVVKPGFASPSWYNEICKPVTSPLSQAHNQAHSYFEWNSGKRICAHLTARFNDRLRFKVTEEIAFKDNALVVVCQKQITWETLMRL